MKKILLVSCILLLGGCSMFGKRDKVEVSNPIEVITTSSYPDLPDMSHPPKLNLMTPKWDYPRDMEAPMTIKNLTTCKNVPEEKQDDDFWAECGEYPIIPNSNIYRGYSYPEWLLFRENEAAIRGKLKEYEVRIDEINRQRREWREKNAEERKKVENAKQENK